MKIPFVSAALREAGLPLGTPLNKHDREWKPFPPLRWMLRRDLKAQGSDPRLPRYSGKCWCPSCGAYFGSSGTFRMHLVGGECLSFSAMSRRGWLQTETGHWVRGKRSAHAVAQRRGAATASGRYQTAPSLDSTGG